MTRLSEPPKMARGAIVYRAEMTLSLIDRDLYEEQTLTIARHPSETLERTLVRTLAFALRFEPGLKFGRGVSATDEAALWSRDGDTRIRQWIDVGQPEAKRIIKSARQSTRLTLFTFGDGARRWRIAQLDTVDPKISVHVAHFDDGFLSSLAQGIERQIRWSITLSEGTLYLTQSNDSFETTPEIWRGSPLD